LLDEDRGALIHLLSAGLVAAVFGFCIGFEPACWLCSNRKQNKIIFLSVAKGGKPVFSFCVGAAV
jgi:hypothetical protein